MTIRLLGDREMPPTLSSNITVAKVILWSGFVFVAIAGLAVVKLFTPHLTCLASKCKIIAVSVGLLGAIFMVSGHALHIDEHKHLK